MDKLHRFFPLGLFLAYFTKIMIKGADYVDAPILAIITILAIALELKTKDKKINQLESTLAQTNAKLDEQAIKIEELRTYTSTLKLGQMRSGTNVR